MDNHSSHEVEVKMMLEAGEKHIYIEEILEG